MRQQPTVHSPGWWAARRSTVACVAALAVALGGPAWAQPPGNVSVSVGPSYVLGPGDEVRIEVVGEPDMSGDRPVFPDGTIDLAYAGRVEIGGLTLTEATGRVRDHLAEKVLVNPQVVLGIARLASKQVEVSGGVNKQGEYVLDRGDMRVSTLLVVAGGLVDPSTPRAEIWRDGPAGRQVIPVDLERIREGDFAADLEVLPDDHLVIPQPQQVFVDGQVEKPGGYLYRDGMTISQAVAQAGGEKGTAKTNSVQLLRGSERIEVNLKRIRRGVEADVVLRPGDQVYVPESVF